MSGSLRRWGLAAVLFTFGALGITCGPPFVLLALVLAVVLAARREFLQAAALLVGTVVALVAFLVLILLR